MLRRIVYINPVDGKGYTYITNDLTLPAYQLVLLYKHRWDLEKIFDQFKNKMLEQKSWASTLVAKQSHAIFECLAHNLLMLFEQYLCEKEGLHDALEEKKQKGRDKSRNKGAVGKDTILVAGNFINTAITRATQRTQRFIRWVGNWIYQQVTWCAALARLRVVWGMDPK